MSSKGLSPLDHRNKHQQNKPEGEDVSPADNTRREENNSNEGTDIQDGSDTGEPLEGEKTGEPLEGEETGETDYPDFSTNHSNRNRHQEETDSTTSDRQTDSLRKLLSLLRSGQLSDNQKREVMQRLLQARGPDYGGD